MLWLVNWNLTSQDPLNTELMAEGWEHMEHGKDQMATGQQQVSYTSLDPTIFVETNKSYIPDILQDQVTSGRIPSRPYKDYLKGAFSTFNHNVVNALVNNRKE